MSQNSTHDGKRRTRLAAVGAFSLIAVFTPGMLNAWDSPLSGILRIEEDWQIVLDEPGDDLSVPQFHTVMSPYGSQGGVYFQVSWNYRELPDFQSGGLQLQVWNGDTFYANRDVDGGAFSNSAETVSWTQALSIDDRDLTFSVSDGHSSSWGSFGGESMTVRMPRSIHSIDGYSTDASAGGSWITYGSNRVVRLQITEVRTYDADGLRSRVTTPRVIYQYEENGD